MYSRRNPTAGTSGLRSITRRRMSLSSGLSSREHRQLSPLSNASISPVVWSWAIKPQPRNRAFLPCLKRTAWRQARSFAVWDTRRTNTNAGSTGKSRDACGVVLTPQAPQLLHHYLRRGKPKQAEAKSAIRLMSQVFLFKKNRDKRRSR